MENNKEIAENQEPKAKRKYKIKIRAVKHQNNPFMQVPEPFVGIKTKKIMGKSGNFMIKKDSGEVVSDIAGFWHAEEVDSTKFLKLYVNGVKAFSNLSTKGTKVFELMYHEMQRNIGKDKIYLNFSSIDINEHIAKTTFYDGVSELVEKKFLAPTTLLHWFWVNPDYVWNGDRLSFVKTYVKKQNPKSIIDEKTKDLFEEEPQNQQPNQGE